MECSTATVFPYVRAKEAPLSHFELPKEQLELPELHASDSSRSGSHSPRRHHLGRLRTVAMMEEIAEAAYQPGQGEGNRDQRIMGD